MKETDEWINITLSSYRNNRHYFRIFLLLRWFSIVEMEDAVSVRPQFQPVPNNVNDQNQRSAPATQIEVWSLYMSALIALVDFVTDGWSSFLFLCAGSFLIFFEVFLSSNSQAMFSWSLNNVFFSLLLFCLPVGTVIFIFSLRPSRRPGYETEFVLAIIFLGCAIMINFVQLLRILFVKPRVRTE